jgi:hypothetical protein
MATRIYRTEKDFRKDNPALILMQPGRLRAPKTMSLNGDRLAWDRLSEDRTPLPSKDLLEDFWQLSHTGKPADYLRFARRWGPLGLCEDHGKPCTHASDCHPRETKYIYSEPLSGWQDYAKKFEAAVWVAYKNTEKEKCTPEEWHLVGGSGDAWHVSAQALKLAETVNTWLRDGDVRPQVKLEGKPLPYIQAGLGGYPLFGTLTWLLAEYIFSDRKLAFCYGCLRPFHPGKKTPKKGQKSWCPRCKEDGT